MLIAILHLLGTLLVLFVLFIVTGSIENYRSGKRLDRALTTAAIRLGIPASKIEEREHAEKLARYLANEFDSNKFRNRLSDVSQPFFVLYEGLTYLIQLGIVAAATWFAFTADHAYARVAWVAVAVAIILWIGNLLLGAMLYLVTGRAPGESKGARKIAAKLNRENV